MKKLFKNINSEYINFSELSHISFAEKLFCEKRRNFTLFSAFLSYNYYTEILPRETFLKFVQVGMKHHYNNALDFNLGFYSHIFFKNFNVFEF